MSWRRRLADGRLRRIWGGWHWSAFRVAWSVPLVAFGTWGLFTALRLDAAFGSFFVLACGLSGLLGPDRGAAGWRRIANEHALTFFPRSFTRGRSIAGTFADQRVTLLEDPLKWNRATLVVSERIPNGFTLYRRSILAEIGGRVVRTADERFDQAIVLHGDAAAALAAVGDERRRKALVDLLPEKRPVLVSHGAVRMTLAPLPDEGGIEMAMILARDLASALSCGDSEDEIAASLLHTVKSKAPPDLRIACLRAMVERFFPQRDEARLALKAARHDTDDHVAFAAAEALGAESLAEYARETGRDRKLVYEGLKRISKSLDDSTRMELIGAMLGAPLPGALRGAGPIAALDAMILFDDLKDATLSAPSYLAALENKDEGVRETAARNLKWVAGPEALEPLKRLVERHPDGKDAKEALASMRALGEGREGELSLGTPDVAGDLSLAGGSAELSMAEKAKGAPVDTVRRKS